MPDAELLHAWQANGISDPELLDHQDWRRCAMIVQARSGQQAYVRRHQQHLWSLNYAHNAPRNRWGNLAEINADIAFFMSTGRLPEPKGSPR
jgi:hypothetical protein